VVHTSAFYMGRLIHDAVKAENIANYAHLDETKKRQRWNRIYFFGFLILGIVSCLAFGVGVAWLGPIWRNPAGHTPEETFSAVFCSVLGGFFAICCFTSVLINRIEKASLQHYREELEFQIDLEQYLARPRLRPTRCRGN
jgi:hypothetical protein